MPKHLLRISLFALLFALSTGSVFAQWVAQTSGTTATLRGVKAVSDQVVWACGASGVVLKTTDGGTTWAAMTPTLATATNYVVEALDATTAWVTGTVGGSADVSIWKTTNGGTSWLQQYNNPAGFGDGLRFFNANEGFYCGDPDPFPSTNWEIAVTSNGGTNWTRLPKTAFPPADSVAEEFGSATGCAIHKASGTAWFVSYYNQTTTNAPKIYKSTNKGNTWVSYNLTLPSGVAQSFPTFASQTHGVAVATNGDVVRTTDGGSIWTGITLAGKALRGVCYVPGHNAYVTVGSSGYSAYSKDNGATWTELTGGSGTIRTVDASTNYAWYVGNSGAIARLANSALPVELTSFTAVSAKGKVVLNWATATEMNNRGFEVQRKTDGAGEWAVVGFVNGRGTATTSNSYSYTDEFSGSGVVYYRLRQVDFDGQSAYSEAIEVSATPATFTLEQNFPNPFNPTTTISFEMPEAGFVTLKVMNLLGEEVATLISETRAAGRHTIDFNASNLSSGVYLYTVSSGIYTATKKLTLMK